MIYNPNEFAILPKLAWSYLKLHRKLNWLDLCFKVDNATEKKAPEPEATYQLLTNPARVIPAQEKFIKFLENSRTSLWNQRLLDSSSSETCSPLRLRTLHWPMLPQPLQEAPATLPLLLANRGPDHPPWLSTTSHSRRNPLSTPHKRSLGLLFSLFFSPFEYVVCGNLLLVGRLFVETWAENFTWIGAIGSTLEIWDITWVNPCAPACSLFFPVM